MKNKVWENVLSLYGVQAATYVAPLVLLPYLARVLGRDEWGALAFAESFSNIVSTVLEYGFGLSATRSVSAAREHPLERSRILGAVIGAQSALAAAAALITAIWIGTSHSPLISNLLPYALVGGIARAFDPIWYFQAREKIRTVTAVYMGSNLLVVALVIVMVKSPGQVWLVLAIKALFLLASSAVGLALAYRDTPVVWPFLADIWNALKEGWPLFLFRGSVVLFGPANVLLLGFLASPAVVAWFAGAEKISKAVVGVVLPLSQGFYPRINYVIRNDHQSAHRVTADAARFTIALGVAGGAALWLAAPILVRIGLGPGFERSIPVLRILALIPAVVSVSSAFGSNRILPLKMDRQFTAIIFLSGAVNLVLAAPLTWSLGEKGMALSVTTAQTVAAVGMLALCWRKGIISSSGFTSAAAIESARMAC